MTQETKIIKITLEDVDQQTKYDCQCKINPIQNPKNNPDVTIIHTYQPSFKTSNPDIGSSEYNYVFTEVKYSNDEQYTSSLDKYYYKCEQNIKLLIFLEWLYLYLITVRKIDAQSDITDAINRNFEIMSKSQNLDKEINQLVRRQNRIVYIGIGPIVNEITINDSMETNKELKLLFLKFKDNYQNLKNLSQDKKQILDIYFINGIKTNIRSLIGDNDLDQSISILFNYLFKQTYDQILNNIQVEGEQTTVTGVPGKHDDDCDIWTNCNQLVAKKCGNAKRTKNVFFYVSLYEDNIDHMDNLVISMFSLNMQTGITNWYICKNIRYTLKKLFALQKPISNSALKLHSITLFYFGNKPICTMPISSMMSIFEQEEKRGNIIINREGNRSLKKEQQKMLYGDPNYSSKPDYLCRILPPDICVVATENSPFLKYCGDFGKEYVFEGKKSDDHEFVLTFKRRIVGGYYKKYTDNKKQYEIVKNKFNLN